MNINEFEAIDFAVRRLLARIEEQYGTDVWIRNPSRTDLEEAARELAKLFPPKGK